MGLLFNLVLILLGLIGAEAIIGEKFSDTKKYLAILKSNQQIIALVGFVLGVLAFCRWLDSLELFKYAPLRELFAMVAILSGLALSFIFGLDYVRPTLKGDAAQYVIKAESFRARLLPYQKILSFIAIFYGTLSVLLFIALILGFSPMMMR